MTGNYQVFKESIFSTAKQVKSVTEGNKYIKVTQFSKPLICVIKQELYTTSQEMSLKNIHKNKNMEEKVQYLTRKNSRKKIK